MPRGLERELYSWIRGKISMRSGRGKSRWMNAERAFMISLMSRDLSSLTYCRTARPNSSMTGRDRYEHACGLSDEGSPQSHTHRILAGSLSVSAPSSWKDREDDGRDPQDLWNVESILQHDDPVPKRVQAPPEPASPMMHATTGVGRLGWSDALAMEKACLVFRLGTIRTRCRQGITGLENFQQA